MWGNPESGTVRTSLADNLGISLEGAVSKNVLIYSDGTGQGASMPKEESSNGQLYEATRNVDPLVARLTPVAISRCRAAYRGEIFCTP